ncbi:hypothetical protein [Blastococcus sp. SYSU DS0973]
MNVRIEDRAGGVAAAAAIGAVGAWLAKAVVIAASGGLGRSALEGPLFLTGLLLLVLAFIAGGVSVAGGGPARRALTGAVAAVVGIALALLIETGVDAVLPESSGWVAEEAGLWAVSLLTAAVLGGRWLRRRNAVPV